MRRPVREREGGAHHAPTTRRRRSSSNSKNAPLCFDVNTDTHFLETGISVAPRKGVALVWVSCHPPPPLAADPTDAPAGDDLTEDQKPRFQMVPRYTVRARRAARDLRRRLRSEQVGLCGAVPAN